MQMSLNTVLQATKGRWLHPDLRASMENTEITHVATDSRQAKPGSLFVCLKGEKTDGHAHAAAAVAAGAVAVLAEHDPFDGELNAKVLLTPVLLVENSLKALGHLAHAWRKIFGGKVVGITGTAGKTTAKEMLAHVLSGHAPTARNPMNLNTQEGMPLSMLACSGTESFWVMEAGISHAHDMDELAPILEPNLALILNVGAGHTEGLGNRNVANCKARLLGSLAPHGQALVSADYPDLVRETRSICPTATYFSCTGKPMPYRASYAGANDAGLGVYRLWLDGTAVDVESPLRGPYGAENSIAVAAAAHLLGLSLEEIVQGLRTVSLPQQRFARFDCGPWHVVDDSYNANPLSCARMLEAASELATDFGSGTATTVPLVCVLGEMLELGNLAEEEHENLGRHIAATKAQAVFWVGGHAEAVRRGLVQERFANAFVPLVSPQHFLQSWDENSLSSLPGRGVVLFKGSRGNRLENYVTAFKRSEAEHAL